MFIENEQHRFLLARWSYLMGEPIISDVEYDKLEKKMKQEYPNLPSCDRPWSFDECPVELLRQYGLGHLVCNTTMRYMAESIESLNTEADFNQVLSGLNERSRLSYKIDGWNTRASYFKGNIVKIETRGRSGNNLDMSNIHEIFPDKVPWDCRVAVTGELSIPNSKWGAYKDITGNNDQRASVRTALARNDISYLSFLAFNIFIEDEDVKVGDSYELLNSLGFKTPKFVWVNNFKELEQGIDYLSLINPGYGYLTDGLVIENSRLQRAIRLGEWQEQVMCSYVTGYEENQGMYGTFLKVKCAPIRIEGKKFTKISINNIANIVENHLEIGSPIAFSLRSAANVVLDVTETNVLQKRWAGKYEEYRKTVKLCD